MNIKSFVCIGAAICASSPVYAEGFTGGEVGYEYNQHNDDRSVDGITYSGSAEYALTDRFSVAVDLSYFDTSEDVARAGIHSIFKPRENLALGLFYAASDDESALYGAEGNIEIFGGDLALYVGEFEDDISSATVIGMDTDVPLFGTPITVFTEFDLFLDGDNASLKNEVGIAYAFEDGAEVYMQYGQLDTSDGVTVVSNSYFGVGGRIRLGANGDTTFERR